MIDYKKVSRLTPLDEKELNVLGKEGWDNYAIVGNTFYFKREAKERGITTNNQQQKNSNAVKGRK